MIRHYYKDQVNNIQSILGPTGPKGDTGDIGPQSPPGLQGERGLTVGTGATGQPGEDGMDGAQGAPGLNGINGKQGSSGLTNIHGTNYYSIIGNISPLTPSNGNTTALCLPGDVAISGKYEIIGNLFFSPTIIFFGSLGSNPPVNEKFNCHI